MVWKLGGKLELLSPYLQCSLRVHIFWTFLFLLPAISASAVERPLVATSIRPLELIVKDLAGDLVESKVIVENSASPHDFALTIGQAFMVNDADLLVWIGPSFESFLASGVYTRNKVALEGLITVDHTDDHHHDFHFWLDSHYAETFAGAIAENLKALLPDAHKELDQNLSQFKKRMQKRREKTAKDMRPYAKVPFAVYHDGYRYFVEEYGLRQVAQMTRVSHEKLSAKRLNEVGKKITQAVCLLAGRDELREAKRYANLFEKPLVEIDLLATDTEVQTYDDYLAAIAYAFRNCFDQKKPGN